MFIEEVMELVELTPLKEALVGLPGVNGLSTEQRKRLTIAVELVANPSIIFMDEPTSGLDARAAAIVMRTVRNTVDTGRTVVCTIHQPSIDIFDAFDELLLLKRGGEEIYVGPLGRHSVHLIEYFEGIDGVSKIKDGYNPATWMLEVTSTPQEEALGVNFVELYKNSELCTEKQSSDKGTECTETGIAGPTFLKTVRSIVVDAMQSLPMETALVVLEKPTVHRCQAHVYDLHRVNVRNHFLGSRLQKTRQQDIFNAMGSMYVAVLFLGVQNATSVQPVVAIERTVFYRERAAGMYSALPYAFGQAVVELPHLFIQTLVYGVIVYAMIGFEWTVDKFVWYIFFMYFTLLYFTLYGMMTVAVTPNHNIATVVSSAFYAIWNLFSGFIIPKTRIPVWWRWYYYICPIAWTLYGLVASQFGDVEARLDTNETVKEFVRSYFDYRHDFVGYVAIIIVGIAVLFGFIFAFSIRAFNFQTR
ncbi:transcription factor [Castilleja foliolosa]|uniref:Transcription factor n=1 Tax=Castilleja foliolosa TaxID=1961234 RepID=A0ABD3BFQ5_9LAMI